MARLTTNELASLINEVVGLEDDMAVEECMRKFEKSTDPEQCPDCGVWGCNCYLNEKEV
jgi:hypothetical protein